MIHVYKASAPVYLTAGNNTVKLVGFFTTPEVARLAVDSTMQRDTSGKNFVNTIEVYESVLEWQLARRESLRQSAYNKLTPEERGALGV